MRNKIAYRLGVFVLSVLLLVSVVLTYTVTTTTKANIEAQLDEDTHNIQEIIQAQLIASSTIQESYTDLLDARLLDVARAVGLIEGVTSEQLKVLSAQTGISEINIADRTGDTIASNLAQSIGEAYVEGDATYTVLNKPNQVVIEPIRESAEGGNFYKYVAVGTPTGAIQVGLEATEVLDLLKVVDIAVSIENLVKESSNLVQVDFYDGASKLLGYKESHIEEADLGTLVKGELNYDREAKLYRYYSESAMAGHDIIITVDSTGIDALMDKSTTSLVVQLLVMMILLGVGIYFINKYTLMKPFTKLEEMVGVISDFDTREHEWYKEILDNPTEIGSIANKVDGVRQHIKGMVEVLSAQIDTLNHSNQVLVDVVDQNILSMQDIAKTAEELATGAEDQANSTADSTEQSIDLGDMISDSIEDTQKILEINTGIRQSIENGLQGLEKLDLINIESNKEIEKVNSVIAQTNMSAQEIVEASNLISQIVDQTSLLALNASIEAARAGDAGRGFAVVAQEIGKLAVQSSQSTERINKVINTLIENTQGAVSAIERLNKTYAAQVTRSDKNKKDYEEIEASVDALIEITDTTKANNERMQKSKEVILDNLQSLSAISQENSAATEEVTATIEEQLASMIQIQASGEKLTEVAELLREQISKIIL